MTCNYDFFPSVLEHLGLEGRLSDSPKLPGSSYAAAFKGDSGEREEVVFHEYENARMIRTWEWKLTRRRPNGPDQLFDMKNDPGERENLIDATEAQLDLADLQRQLEGFFEKYADPEYDLWKGGRSKAGLLIKE